MKPHPFDAISFTFGIVLLAVGVLVSAGEVSWLFGGWLMPALIIGAGVLLIFAGWRVSRNASAATSPDEG